MANSQSPHSKKIRAETSARWLKEQQEAGAYRLSALLPPETAAKLRAIAERGGKSISATVIEIIDAAWCR